MKRKQKENISSLEKQFKEAQEKANKEIEKYENEALALLNKAIEVSEKYGVPYNFNITNLSNQFVPESFSEKWRELDSELLEEYDTEYSGWQHSDIC